MHADRATRRERERPPRCGCPQMKGLEDVDQAAAEGHEHPRYENAEMEILDDRIAHQFLSN